MAEPRELGIPFSTPLVLAIANTKPGAWPAEPMDPLRPFKWQTRRLMNPQPDHCHRDIIGKPAPWKAEDWERLITYLGEQEIKPRYPLGSRLYVKECWARVSDGDTAGICYRTDGEDQLDRERGERWQSGRFMPKAAARFWLEVMRVRVERLEQISEEDARAEGLVLEPCGHPDCGPGTRCAADSYRGAFAVTWNRLHAKDAPWGSGVWVFVYDFKVLSSQKGAN